MMVWKQSLTAAALALAVGLAGAPAMAAGGVKVGTLTCDTSSGWGFVFASTRDLHCTFADNEGKVERYSGQIQKFGMDVGYYHNGVIAWAVFAPTADVAKGALAGGYIGPAASAAVGAGGGAAVLTGGSASTLSLQPISVEGYVGLNAAAGIESITLKAVE